MTTLRRSDASLRVVTRGGGRAIPFQHGPGGSREQAAAIACPTLIVGNRRDAIHPLAVAEGRAAAIPGARQIEVHPEADDPVRHASEAREAIRGFLVADFPAESVT